MADTAVDESRAVYWIGCSMVPGLGPMRLKRLLGYFASIEQVWEASGNQLRQAGLESKVADAFVSTRATLSLEKIAARLAASNVTVLAWDSAGYPALLREVYAPPPVVYMRGTLQPGDETALAVVGTRQPTSYGKHVAEQLVTDLVANGLTIVSGLARGIDTIAHRTAIYQHGRTVAVLGNGIDVTYPPENARLADEIASAGALLSEYPLGARPEAVNFPARNRIIAGMTLGTLVVEAGTRSGALITGAMALEAGREVFAVPGNIFSRQSEGTNSLIQQGGAKLVASAQDILVELNVTAVTRQMEMKELVPANDTESRLLALLSAEPVHVDEVARAVGLPIRDVSGALLLMELKGMVRSAGAMTYVLAR